MSHPRRSALACIATFALALPLAGACSSSSSTSSSSSSSSGTSGAGSSGSSGSSGISGGDSGTGGCNVAADCPPSTSATCVKNCADGTSPCQTVCVDHHCAMKGCP